MSQQKIDKYKKFDKKFDKKKKSTEFSYGKKSFRNPNFEKISTVMNT